MADTVADLIKGALRKINVIEPGGTLGTLEASDALDTLNEMLDSWSTDNLLVLAVERETFDLVAGTGSYTIGSGGDFDTVRPVRIRDAGVIIDPSATNTIEYPISVLRSSTEWSRIVTKNTQSDYPSVLYYESDYPLGTINLWDKPSSSTPDLVLYSEKLLTQYTDTTDSVSLAPGYARAIKYNLAIELAPEYGIEPSQALVAVAIEAKAQIQLANLRIPNLAVDAALLRLGDGGRYRVLTDGYN